MIIPACRTQLIISIMKAFILLFYWTTAWARHTAKANHANLFPHRSFNVSSGNSHTHVHFLAIEYTQYLDVLFLSILNAMISTSHINITTNDWPAKNHPKYPLSPRHSGQALYFCSSLGVMEFFNSLLIFPLDRTSLSDPNLRTQSDFLFLRKLVRPNDQRF